MAIPPTASRFRQALDPHEELDYIVDCSTILNNDEQINSFTLTLLSESVALGLTIMDGVDRDPHLTPDNRSILMWLEVDSEFEDNPAYSGTGVDLPIEVTIVTDSSPQRIRQRTILVSVVQQ